MKDSPQEKPIDKLPFNSDERFDQNEGFVSRGVSIPIAKFPVLVLMLFILVTIFSNCGGCNCKPPAEDCQAYLNDPNDTTVKNYQRCREVFFCNQFRKDSSAANTLAYLKVYQGETDSTCYHDALSRLDYLDCEKAKVAENKLISYEFYLDKYGSNGICSAAFEKEMEACEALRGEQECQPFLDYLDQYGYHGLCSDFAKDFLADQGPKCLPNEKNKTISSICFPEIKTDSCREIRTYFFGSLAQDFCLDGIGDYLVQNCGVPQDSVDCQIAKQRGDCASLKYYTDTYHKKFGSCYDELYARWKKQCKPKTHPDAFKIGGLWIMRQNAGREQASDTYPIVSDYQAEYGAFYKWSAPKGPKPCPDGWRLPCKKEVEYLLTFYQTDRFRDLTDPDRANIQLNGVLNYQGKADWVGTVGYYWTSTPSVGNSAWAIRIDAINTDITLERRNKTEQLSCRCVKKADDYKNWPMLRDSDCDRLESQ